MAAIEVAKLTSVVACALAAPGCGRYGYDTVLGDGSAASSDTSDGAADDATVDAAPPLNRAFVTSSTHGIPFGGRSAANAVCQNLADSAQLGGTFIALLGDSTVAAPTLLASARGWVDVAGRPIADLPTDWFDNTMRGPVIRDETGTLVGYKLVWLGARTTSTCSDWTSTTENGSSGTTANPFSAFSVGSCAQSRRFVCVETSHVTPLVVPVTSGRYAFATVGKWMPGGGLLGADNVCAGEASGLLPGTYKAMLATAAAGSPLARLAQPAGPWVTVGGRYLADSFTPTTVLDAFLLSSDGSPAPGSVAAWAWTGTAGANCLDWTSTTDTGNTGDLSSATVDLLLARQAYACDSPRPLLCLQD